MEKHELNCPCCGNEDPDFIDKLLFWGSGPAPGEKKYVFFGVTKLNADPDSPLASWCGVQYDKLDTREKITLFVKFCMQLKGGNTPEDVLEKLVNYVENISFHD